MFKQTTNIKGEDTMDDDAKIICFSEYIYMYITREMILSGGNSALCSNVAWSAWRLQPLFLQQLVQSNNK